MICLLTSLTHRAGEEKIYEANHFLDELRRHFPNPCRALHICSNPNRWDDTDDYAARMKKLLEDAGFAFEQYMVLDGRNEQRARELVREANFLFLSGGHVPTQNAFFQKIGLRGLLEDFDGLLIGESAGSMNCADVVYALPEEPGEAVDPNYQRFLRGLNLTTVNILPHYQDIKDNTLDGLKLFDDMACPDSMGRTFYAIPDGSYLYIDNGKEELRGEAYRVQNGMIRQISAQEEIVSL